MELGNMIFGHSRGNVEVPRHAGYEDQLFKLLKLISSNDWESYAPEFVNSVFETHPYYWGDCLCPDEHSHESDCLAIRPNFLFKPTGYELRWYKYPLRDSYASEHLDVVRFGKMIERCITSL